MGKPTGFLEYKRETAKVLPPKVRIANFKEFRTPLNKEKQKLQGARCMACGVPFCQSGMMIGGMVSGCPLNNLVPEWNDLIYNGNWEQAWRRLMKTNSFPEFTSRVCPALCEAACTCGDVNKLLKQFEMMQKMMKQFKKSPKGFARRLGGMMGNPNAFRGLK